MQRYKIVLCGEAFGEAEEKAGVPFVGTAGRVLDGILQEVGLPRAMCHITNVVMARPPNNDFSIFYEKKRPTPELLQHRQRLYNELVSIGPNLIVCLGAEATRAVCGDAYQSVQHWRGSLIQTPFGKAMPTIHPAAVLREWLFRPAVVADMARAAQQMEFPEIRQRKRELVVSYNFDEVMGHLERLKGVKNVTFDIETESGQITCIGFSDRAEWAICVPFWFGSSGSLWSESQETAIWGRVSEILTDPGICKIGHNGIYDMEFLHNTMRIDVRGYGFDTMLGFHCLYPELPKGLDYLVSIYTDHPYHKFGRRAATMDEHFRYNATDCCLTFECYECVSRELDEANLRSFYDRYMHALVAPILRMQLRGVNFDLELRDRLRRDARVKIKELHDQLTSALGFKLNINSPKQMKEWLYGKSGLGLKPIYKNRKGAAAKIPDAARAEKLDKIKWLEAQPRNSEYGQQIENLRAELAGHTQAADEEALESLYKESGNENLKTVLAIREVQKILSTYLEVDLDEDKRIRCSYLIHGTETGRLSSRQTARGTGTNLQNIPSGDIKRLFVADEGRVFLNADLSQAEARVVAYLSGEERLIRVFESGGDIHRRNAANMFGIKESDVSDEQRQLAKRVVHASNYGMGPRTFSRQAGIPEKDALRLLNQYFATYPRIKIWHRAVADELQRKRVLHTPYGRRRIFFGRWGDSLVKEGLAFIPQSTVAEIVNQAIIELDQDGHEILLQVHDSILVQAPENDVENTVIAIRDAMTRPIIIGGRTMVIPVDVKVGVNWEDMKKWAPIEASPQV